MVHDRVDLAHPSAVSFLLSGFDPDPAFVGPAVVAWLAGVAEADVYASIPGGLGAAIDWDRGLFDLRHAAALKYFEEHPFAVDENGEVIVVAGMLAPAAIGDDMIDADHPYAAVFGARCPRRP
jgi:hypothetical protein